MFRGVYADLALMEEEIRRSDTEWTLLRPPRLVNRALTGSYRTEVGANVARGFSISRADAAHALFAAVDNPAMIRQPVGIAY